MVFLLGEPFSVDIYPLRGSIQFDGLMGPLKLSQWTINIHSVDINIFAAVIDSLLVVNNCLSIVNNTLSLVSGNEFLLFNDLLRITTSNQ